MRNYYVKYNPFGTNFTPDSIGWDILIFASRAERAAWLEENYHNGNNRVASAVYAKYIGRYLRAKAGQTIVTVYDEGRKANKLEVRW